jgi:hypothetical protein
VKKTRDGDAAWRLSVGENGGGEEDWRMDLPPAFVVMPHLGARFGLDLPSSLVRQTLLLNTIFLQSSSMFTL